jgi:hypothetical protein
MPQLAPVNPEFGAGSSAAILIDARDETRLNHKIALKETRELLKRTTFQSPDNSEELSYGLLSGMVNVEGYLSQDAATVSAQMATFIGKNRNKKYVLVAPSGFALGYEAVFCETKAQDFDVDVTYSGITTVAAGFATSQSGLIDGQVLHSPHNAPGGVGNEIVHLMWNAVSPQHFFALRAAGTAPQSAQFQLSSYVAAGVVNTATLSAFIKAQIEALAAYGGRTVTITVLAPFVLNSGLWTGTLQLTFDGAVNVPELEVISGAVRRRRVVNGDGGNYSFDGAAPRALPISQVQFDTDQKAIDGAHSASVSIGNSTAAGVDESTVQNIATGGVPTTTSGDPAGNAFDNSLASGVGLDIGNRIRYTFAANVTRRIMRYEIVVTDRRFLTGNKVTGIKLYGVDNAGTATLLETKAVANYNFDGNSDAILTFNLAPTANYRAFEIELTATTLGPGNAVDFREVKFYDGTVNTASLDFITYFPVAAIPGALTFSGQGASNTAVALAGSISSATTTLSIQQGGPSGLNYNLVSASGQDNWVDAGAAGAQFDAILSVLKLIGAGATLTVIIDHADDNGAGAPGAVTQAASFDAASASGVQFKRAIASQLKRWRRVRWTLTGTNPLAVFAVAAAS